MIVGRIIGWVLIALALAVLGLALVLWLTGADMTAMAGQLWYDLAPGGLNLTQAITQRYIHPALWDEVMLPILQWPAYLALAVAVLTPLTAGSLFLAAFHRRRRRRIFG